MTSGSIPFILNSTRPCYLSFAESHKFPVEGQKICKSRLNWVATRTVMMG